MSLLRCCVQPCLLATERSALLCHNVREELALEHLRRESHHSAAGRELEANRGDLPGDGRRVGHP